MKRSIAMIFVALVLGLGWAIRGHFGHEYGAAWAGAMGGLAIIAAAKRKDWSNRLPIAASLAGIGWGVGGMMSYGIVVGYGRGLDFVNVYYGLAMLGVIGALYGYIGGGFLGLVLETSDEKRPQWSQLLTEMIAGGLFAWWILIYQFEWKMTPPRSELWAGCFGAAIALAWFMHRNDFSRSLRVAGYAALGGGFGFAFGNFLQTMGTASGLSFNWWNVMEFTLGFCGGLGMAYGVFTSEWPESAKPTKSANWMALVFLFLALPITNVIHAFHKTRFDRAAEQLGVDPAVFWGQQVLFAYLTVLIFAIIGFFIIKRISPDSKTYAPAMMFAVTLYYTVMGILVKLSLYTSLGIQLEQILYWVVILIFTVMWMVNRKNDNTTLFDPGPSETWKRWLIIIGSVLVVLAICTVIAINSHDGLGGFHERF